MKKFQNMWTTYWVGSPRSRYQFQNESIKVDVDLDARTCACGYSHVNI